MASALNPCEAYTLRPGQAFEKVSEKVREDDMPGTGWNPRGAMPCVAKPTNRFLGEVWVNERG